MTVDQVVASLRKFLLTLSDQQLVTGIGICIAAYVSICSTQLHDFLNGCHLALLSFAVHALTMTTLQPQFRRNRGRARFYLRLVLAGVNVVLLSPIFFHTAFTRGGAFNESLEVYPASCIFTGSLLENITPGGWAIFGAIVCLIVLTCAAVVAHVFLDVDGRKRRWRLVRILPYLSAGLVGVCVLLALCVTAMRISGISLGDLSTEGTANVWGFGQILPVALLLLTPLALLEMGSTGKCYHVC